VSLGGYGTLPAMRGGMSNCSTTANRSPWPPSTLCTGPSHLAGRW